MNSPNPAFVALTRNPSLPPPQRVERTTKREEDVEIVSEALLRRGQPR